jgi:hypothetical protein
MPAFDPATALLLRTALRHLVAEPDADAGVLRIQEITGGICSDRALHEAISDCLRKNLIHEPVRLPAGALHCHWRLQLTPDGVEAARALLQTTEAI